jgi:two-component system, sensor histidine kinase and response regulator
MSQTGLQVEHFDAATGGDGQSSTRPASSGLVARISLSAFTVGIGLAVLFAVLFLAIIGLRDRSLEARNSQQVIASANQLLTLVVDMESGVRGFFISGKESDLKPWKDAQRQLPTVSATLQRLTKDNPLQHERAVSIKRLVDDYLTTFSKPLVLFMRRNPPLARQFIGSSEGSTRIAKIRESFARLLATEKTLGDSRSDTAKSTARNALAVGGIGLGTALLLILFGALYVNRAVARPVRLTADAASRIAGGDLSGRLRTDGPGEVGQLERAFNTMAASLERTLADLEERNRTLVESERVKSELVSSVSHELRTPLASILGFSALMLERDLGPDEMTRYLEVVRGEARRLASLLNDLLDLERVEQQNLELRVQEIDLNDLLSLQTTLYTAQSDAHEIQFEPMEEPLVVRGDPDRLAQVVGNLLSNAIKYSPDGGGVRVRAALLGDEAWVWVRDHGLGIPAEHQGQIFTKFFRGDMGSERGIAGTGLGLVLARQIVEAHGGEVGFESEEDAGSTFWFWLPAPGQVARDPDLAGSSLAAARDDTEAGHGM